MLRVARSLAVYKDGRHERSSKVKSKHLHRLLTRCSTGLKSRPLHVSKWNKGQTKTKKKYYTMFLFSYAVSRWYVFFFYLVIVARNGVTWHDWQLIVTARSGVRRAYGRDLDTTSPPPVPYRIYCGFKLRRRSKKQGLLSQIFWQYSRRKWRHVIHFYLCQWAEYLSL